MINWRLLEKKYPEAIKKIKNELGLFFIKDDDENLYEELEDYKGEIFLTKFSNYQNLFSFFDNLGYFINIEKDNYSICLKIFPKKGFIIYKTGFIKREEAVEQAIQEVLEIIEKS